MIDVRFIVPIVRKEHSSNHSHDHTPDRYHRRPAMSDDYPDRSLPLVSALLHTHDRSHVLRIAAPWVGSSSLPSGSSDDLTTARLDRVRSTMPRAVDHLEGARPGRTRLSLGHQDVTDGVLNAAGTRRRSQVCSSRKCVPGWRGP